MTAKWGACAKGAIRAVSAPLVDDTRAFLRTMISTVLSNQANVKLLLRLVKMDTVLDQTGVPKLEENIDNDAILDSMADDAAQAAAQSGFGPGGAGGADGSEGGDAGADEGDAGNNSRSMALWTRRLFGRLRAELNGSRRA